MLSNLLAAYNRAILKSPLITLVIGACIAVFFLMHIPDFELDASADSLVLENDSSLKYYRSIRDQYDSEDFLVVTYSPDKNLFSKEVRADLTRLRDQLAQVEAVSSVVTLLDVPLVDSPPMTLAEISRKVRTLESEDVDVQLAEQELTTSPLYQNLLVNSDGDTTALQVNLATNERLVDLIHSRDKLYEKQDTIPFRLLYAT